MITLKTIKYVEYGETSNEWLLREFEPSKINLIVGMNAAGKSRTLNVINGLACLLSGRIKNIYDNGEFAVNFTDDTKNISYELKFENRNVMKETLLINGKERLTRGENGIGKIFTDKIGKLLDFQSQENQLSVVARRDKIQHPFLEDLINWGSETVLFKFGSGLGKNTMMLPTPTEKDTEPNLAETDKVVGTFLSGVKKNKKNFTNSIIKKMAAVGYNINEVGTKSITMQISGPAGTTTVQVDGISVKEKDLTCITTQQNMSDGMFRVLSLIIQMEYLKLDLKSGLILIDDVGEGLDFERSNSLIKLLIEEANNSHIQLIMTTNDRFVMNNVPLEYWSIIKREGSHCKMYNYKNSQKIFDEFKFSGLANFDFFSRDVLSQAQNN